ncbi:MAG: penicillin acylase family protein [Deltaproteobacteria bacterium]|nr:penicillin acylase family protein [Deltaproteobacteria bacterium]MBW2362740.1 penicillin acylase family protein [Deltaproteobacteria bacterium]
MTQQPFAKGEVDREMRGAQPPRRSAATRPALVGALLGALAALSLSCSTPLRSADEYRARIRRTQGGIPHILADDLGSLGFGTLYAMAEDNVCILADQYLSFGAQRSRALGPEAGNLESDFFYQLLIDRGQGAEPLPRELEQLFRGAAAGYNDFLRESGTAKLSDARCRGASWIREVTPVDVKRVSRADYALAYMLPIVVAAAPPAAVSSELPPARVDPRRFAAAVESYLEVPKRGGSNGIAIGRDASATGSGMLLANPHMPWNEPFQRFYPMHQTVPGKLDALGATLIGRPRVGFGHTADVAWTSTVSTAKRVAFYQLELVPGDPTSYRFDGAARPMRRETVTVEVRNAEGEIEERSHTFYSTHFGALLVANEHFAWTHEHAVAVRMPDAGWRGELSALAQLQAKSVRELKAIHDRHQFLTVNLIAADRGGEVLYGDLGPVPHISDEQAAACAVMHGAAYDGSRSECQWGSDPDAAAPGIFGPARLPFLFRSDFVTNSNDSYWLANPAQPLTGFAQILGSEKRPRTLRTRSGLQMLLGHLQGRAGENGSKLSLEDLQRLALANENFAGQLIRDDVVALCRAHPRAELEDGTAVSLAAACEVLAGWDLHANLDSRGAHLFRQFLAEAHQQQFSRTLPASFVPAVPFDAADPVATPRGLDTASQRAVLTSLANAVHRLEEADIALDARLGKLQGVTRNGEWIPLHGGPEIEGLFNKIEARFQGAAGYPDVTRWSSSWILAVEFTESGPRARGILTYSLSANPDSPHYADQTRMFSRKEWLDLPFHEADVEAAALHDYRVSGPRSE